jgi:hypothetical protein
MIANVINTIEMELTQTFDELFKWFNAGDELMHYSPNSKGWSVRKILEHVSLTNHYLLILIRKGTIKAIQKSKQANYTTMLGDYDLDWERMKVIGRHKSFQISPLPEGTGQARRPGHMEPRGKRPMAEIKYHLQLQLKECLELLHQIEGGEGVLYKTMMSVNNMGKIDVYHYIYFLVQHAKRHITQMERVEIEFNLGI